MSTDRSLVKKDFAQLMGTKRFHFSDHDLNDVPEDQGVYVIFCRKKVLHVGRTYRGKAGLRQRLKNHVRGQSSFANDYLKRHGKELRRRAYAFRCLPLPNWRRRALLEFYATGYLCPAHIGKHQRKDAPQSK